PSPGQKPWSLNTPINAINEEVEAATAEINGRLSDASLSATFVTVSTVDLRAFLAPGQALPNDGTADASDLMQDAIDAVATMAATASPPMQVLVAEGIYRIDSELAAKTRVGIIGAGRNKTIFKPQAQQSFIEGGTNMTWDGTFFDDLLFQDFTVDCRDQTSV